MCFFDLGNAFERKMRVPNQHFDQLRSNLKEKSQVISMKRQKRTRQTLPWWVWGYGHEDQGSSSNLNNIWVEDNWRCQ
jgi:hypothetical protein